MTRRNGIPVIVATSDYGLRTVEQQRPIQRVICPVPGCGRNVALTQSGYLEWHANAHGFCCDGVNMPPERARACRSMRRAGWWAWTKWQRWTDERYADHPPRRTSALVE